MTITGRGLYKYHVDGPSRPLTRFWRGMVVRALTRLARDSTALTRMARHVRHSCAAARHTTISKQSLNHLTDPESSANSSSDLQIAVFLFLDSEFRQATCLAPSIRTLFIQIAGKMHKDSSLKKLSVDSKARASQAKE
jgi:hypothetical protein